MGGSSGAFLCELLLEELGNEKLRVASENAPGNAPPMHHPWCIAVGYAPRLVAAPTNEPGGGA